MNSPVSPVLRIELVTKAMGWTKEELLFSSYQGASRSFRVKLSIRLCAKPSSSVTDNEDFYPWEYRDQAKKPTTRFHLRSR